MTVEHENQSSKIDQEQARACLHRALSQLVAAAPLVHCMTNDVVTPLTANALLAGGASPLMVIDDDESQSMAAIAEGLLINIGTYTPARARAMSKAIDVRHRVQRPWVLDPVAVGVLGPRTEWARAVLQRLPPTIVRGNASEIIALAGGQGGRGTDSTAAAEAALSAAQQLLTQGVSVVAISGATDIIVAKSCCWRLRHGTARLTKITGAGCLLGALMAALVGLPALAPHEAALAATLWLTLAAEEADRHAVGMGSFASALLDTLGALAHDTLPYAGALRVELATLTTSPTAVVSPPVCAPRPPVALTIAGTDPIGGAGLPADLATFRALNVYGASTITAVVAQNTLGVNEWLAMSPALITAQLAAVFEDIEVDAIKIGMLAQADIIDVVADQLEHYAAHGASGCAIILDPVMISTSGHALLAPEAEQRLWARLIPLAGLLTPNLPEAEALLGYDIAPTVANMTDAALALQARGARRVLLKGGHSSGRTAVDILVDAQGKAHTLSMPRVATANTHGTGCVLSSAIAALRAQGHDWLESVVQARRFLHEALQAGQHECFTLGSGPCLIHPPRWVTP